MSERGPDPAQPEGAPPTAMGWYARMERQSSTPQTQVGPSLSSVAASGLPSAAPLGAPAPASGQPRGRRRKPRSGSAARGRPGTPSRSSAVAWWALGALLLAAAAVVAIVYGDQLSGTPAADSQKAKDPAAQSSAPALPSVGESTGTPTDTAAPTTDTAAPTTTSPTATTSAAGGDPLGLGVPMTSPACDGTWVVILGSATNPDSYADDVTALLSRNPEAKYVLTEGACSSLRQRTADGTQLYAVYVGPYPDQAAACAVSTGTGGGAYVKRMDDTTPSDQTWEC